MKQDAALEEGGFEPFMGSVDGLIMGAGSFRTVLGFGEWPYSKPVVVVSNSLTEADIPDNLIGKVQLRIGTPTEIMRSVSGQGWDRVYVDGGALVRSFLRDGLIEDLTLTFVPILIGEGISLFGPLETDIDLELVDATPLPSGMLKTFYRVRK
ncbi:MAG: dihydrofolate reductase family protein [Paracoccaceae bacterium]